MAFHVGRTHDDNDENDDNDNELMTTTTSFQMLFHGELLTATTTTTTTTTTTVLDDMHGNYLGKANDLARSSLNGSTVVQIGYMSRGDLLFLLYFNYVECSLVSEVVLAFLRCRNIDIYGVHKNVKFLRHL